MFEYSFIATLARARTRRQTLTLVVVILIICSAIKHPEYFEDVAVAIIAVEFVTRAVETKNQLPRGSILWRRTCWTFHDGCRDVV